MLPEQIRTTNQSLKETPTFYEDPIEHAGRFSSFLETKRADIHRILRTYESKNVVDDEIDRSIDALRNIGEIRQYFDGQNLSANTAVFLPLNLPLYSFVLFGAMPAYQSDSLIIKSPQRMNKVFEELFKELELDKHYPNIQVFSGSRADFLKNHCSDSSVVIFTGQHDNFQKIMKSTSKDTLMLYNGVGHNPIVVSEDADIDLAVEKSMQVKLFNAGQDCAGSDTILVHKSIAQKYTDLLKARLNEVKCGNDCTDDNVIVGPLFERANLLNIINTISNLQDLGASFEQGGQFDLRNNVVNPTVMRTHVRSIRNYDELYAPVFLVTEYDDDAELALYFEDNSSRYDTEAMYVSLFGSSKYLETVKNSIILQDSTIHDLERGVEEYGGYSHGASSVSFKSVTIAKPLLIPREIHNYLSESGKTILSDGEYKLYGAAKERKIIEREFKKTVEAIFGEKLAFAFIFGSTATEKDKRYSDVDSLICATEISLDQVEEYLDWSFKMHEMFGRIPDFMYPAEIMTLTQLQFALESLETMELGSDFNSSDKYDAVLWGQVLTQQWKGVLGVENIPVGWRDAFNIHSPRILQTYLNSLDASSNGLTSAEFLAKFTKQASNTDLDTLAGLDRKTILKIFRAIPFEDKPVYSDIVKKLVTKREFMGKSVFDPNQVYNPLFRFGVVNS